MNNAGRQRAGSFFPHQARQLREIIKLLKTFGLPCLTTNRAIACIRQIADEIDDRTGTIKQGPKGKKVKS